MISLDSVSLRRGGRLLFENVSLTIHTGQHIGVTGVNGTGKSSLFQLIMGDITTDSGQLTIPAKLNISHMQQEFELDDISAVEYVIDGDTQLRQLEQSLINAEKQDDHRQIVKLHEQIEVIEGYTAHYRAEQLLHGLGFKQEDSIRPVKEFSGGWRIRLNLAQVLMSPGDLLLLDEPNNHLDF